MSNSSELAYVLRNGNPRADSDRQFHAESLLAARSFQLGPQNLTHPPVPEAKHKMKAALRRACLQVGWHARTHICCREQRSDPSAQLCLPPTRAAPSRPAGQSLACMTGRYVTSPHGPETPSPTVCTRVRESKFLGGSGAVVRLLALAFSLGTCFFRFTFACLC